jgi:hypothetical protein
MLINPHLEHADQVLPQNSGYSREPEDGHVDYGEEPQFNEMSCYSGMTSIALIDG